MLERRFERGGTLATDDYSTPFQYNLAQFELRSPTSSRRTATSTCTRRASGSWQPSSRSRWRPSRARRSSIGRGGRGLGPEVEELLAAASAIAAPLLYRARRSSAGAGVDPARARRPHAARARRARGRPGAAIALRYACGLAGFLDGDAPLARLGPSPWPGCSCRRSSSGGRRTSPTGSPGGAVGCRARPPELRGHAPRARRATTSVRTADARVFRPAPSFRRSIRARPSSACSARSSSPRSWVAAGTGSSSGPARSRPTSGSGASRPHPRRPAR